MPKIEQQNTPAKTGALENNKVSLLLVDDDPLILEGLGFILRKQFNLITAESRHQAIDNVDQAE